MIRCCPLNDIAAASALRQEEWEALARLCGELEAVDRDRCSMRSAAAVRSLVYSAMEQNSIDPDTLYFHVAPRILPQYRFLGELHPMYFFDWDVTFRLFVRQGVSFS